MSTAVRTVVCCLHLDSGKSSSRLRSWQLRRIFSALKTVEDAVLLGDFNMRDAENARIAVPYCDVWPALRPDDDGFTEDTAINHMRYDMKNKSRQVRFDRVLRQGSPLGGSRHRISGHGADLGRTTPGVPVRPLRREMPSYTPKSIGRPAGPTADLSATAVATTVSPRRVPTTVTSSFTANAAAALVV